MKTLLGLLLVVIAVGLFANPSVVVINLTEVAFFPMLSESVTVNLQPTVALVSGSFTFAKLPRSKAEHPCISVWVPVVIQEGLIDPNKSLPLGYEYGPSVGIRIGRHETTGQPIHPRNPAYQNHPAIAHHEGLDVLWFAACSEFKRKDTTIYVTYKQQLIDGVFYYIPIIKMPSDTTMGTRSYLLTIKATAPLYPAKGMACRYESPNPREMSVTLTDGALVAVTTDPNKALSSLPTMPK
jgi:hypothetical protein